MKFYKYLTKQFNINDLARFNIKLLWFTVLFHWLSFYDTEFFNPPLLKNKLLKLGFFKQDPHFAFGMVGLFAFSFFLLYVPLTIFDYFVTRVSKSHFKGLLIKPIDMKFQPDNLVNNLIRLSTFILVGLTPYFVYEYISNATIIIPLTLTHMMLLATTIFLHGLLILAILKPIRPPSPTTATG